MGNNLSSTFEPDLSKVVLSPTDRRADIILGVTWLVVIYMMVMIWTTRARVDGASHVGGVAGRGGVSGDGEWMNWNIDDDK
ncbi:hypothetical protein TGAM01_v201264 [Trichoderma gamsii]|uniref:Uncharacterized protein n=1 Tax=Trichoderma gamsii TaxID=398673 RepID=A0A2P5A043_9HYPO|nr:hypothetical protein TGAM01_v201264 [Trichoderma gamsii]PON29898.1 hypothetical protein TGAM01_v201264 [Trichoderma gamsii]